jgi:hypothetical protein
MSLKAMASPRRVKAVAAPLPMTSLGATGSDPCL